LGKSAKEFFESLESRGGTERTAGMTASYVFEIDGSGTWTVAIDDGKVDVSEGDNGGDATISASQATFEKIIDGKQNPLTAYMTGKLKVHGDIGAAMKLQKLF
jgi:putative sterol carrier protein